MSTDTHIPVVVINWNGITDTKECVDSLLNQDYPDFSIHLVDNHSENQEGLRLVEHYADEDCVKVYCHQENLGFARAHNLLFDQFLKSGYKYVALLNNDAVAEPDWLSCLVSASKNKNASMVSSKLIDYYDRSVMDNAGHRMLNTGEIIPVGYRRTTDKYQAPFDNLGASAGACLYSLEMIRRIGGFDEYFVTGYEDAELGLRAYITRHRCVFEPAAIAYHKGGKSIRKVFDAEYAIQIQKNVWYAYFKLVPLSAILVSVPFIMLRMVLFYLLNFVFLRWRHIWIVNESLSVVWGKESKRTFQARSAFFKTHSIISGFSLLRKQVFFLWFDVKRFYYYVLLSGSSALDQYGDNY